MGHSTGKLLMMCNKQLCVPYVLSIEWMQLVSDGYVVGFCAQCELCKIEHQKNTLRFSSWDLCASKWNASTSSVWFETSWITVFIRWYECNAFMNYLCSTPHTIAHNIQWLVFLLVEMGESMSHWRRRRQRSIRVFFSLAGIEHADNETVLFVQKKKNKKNDDWMNHHGQSN